MKDLTFKRVTRGFYTNTRERMSIEHELFWNEGEGRKWVATWHESAMWGLMAPEKRSRKFDSLAEARDFLNGLAK